MFKITKRSSSSQSLPEKVVSGIILFRILGAGLALLVILTASRVATAQCDSCNGRCNYCVDHQCYPRRLTFGYWETNWRRWPVPPPAVGIADMPSPAESAEEFNAGLPPVEEESNPDPDFSHRRKKASRPPAVEPPQDIEEPSPLKPNPFKDDEPQSSRKLGRNMLRSGPQVTTQASFGFHNDNPLRGMAPPAAVRASYDRLPPAPIKSPVPMQSLPRHPNPLRDRM